MHALAITLGVFALILVLGRLGVPLALAIAIGAVAIGLLFGLGGLEVLGGVLAGVIQPKTIALVGVTVMLLVLSGVMHVSGQFEDIVTLARMVFRRPAVAMAALPALVGMLPMPGGALFSAPMVESAASKKELRGDILSAVNFWFRHIWESWWPLYPGVILALSIAQKYTGGGYLPFAAFNLPLGLFMAGAGWLVLRKLHPDLHATSPPAKRGTLLKLLGATSSIWVIVMVWILAKFALEWWVWPRFSPAPADSSAGMTFAAQWLISAERYTPLMIGLAVSVIWTAFLRQLGGREIARVFAGKSIYKLSLLVLSVMVFQYMLGEVQSTDKISVELQKLGVPIVLVVMALPFIAGIVTGLAVGFVGTSFPIVLGLAATMGDGSVRPYVMLAYAFGHMGQMLSPLHVCQIVSNEYFKTTFAPVYRLIIPPAVVTALLAVAYFVVLRMVL